MMKKIKKPLLIMTVIMSGFGAFFNYYLFGFTNIRYFTNQSNLLVFIVSFLMLVNKNQFKFYRALSSIAFISIIITGVIYNLLLRQYEVYWNGIEIMMMWINHTINPLLYGTFHLLFMPNPLKIKQTYMLLLHPLVYFLSYQVFGIFFKYYPYPFMNPILMGYPDMLILNIGILMPSLILFTLLYIYIKGKIDSNTQIQQLQ